jgi:hypothetical protein
VFLHVGDNPRRLESTSDAVSRDGTAPGASFVAGMHAFSLGEVGRFDEAENFGRRALDADREDLWARHALAHVYEHTGNNPAAFALLRDTTDVWADQDLLATHVWWHLALRMLAMGEVAGVLEIFDQELPGATTAFRLCDETSLLWRVELTGHDVGDRWDALADRWDRVIERHTCGFLDLHAVLAFLRRPGHPGAHRWFDGLDARPSSGSEIDEVFETVVAPLVGALRARSAGDPVALGATLDRLGGSVARIGGSNAQRELLTLTAGADRP